MKALEDKADHHPDMAEAEVAAVPAEGRVVPAAPVDLAGGHGVDLSGVAKSAPSVQSTSHT